MDPTKTSLQAALVILEYTKAVDKLDTWTTVEPYDLQYAIAITGQDELFILFQGSKTDIDWRVNFNFFMKPYKSMKQLWFAHRGFTKAYKTVREQIRNRIFVYKPKHILIGGFSQGSAYTVLAHEDLMFNYQDNITVASIGIGGPRVFAFWPFRKQIKACMKGLVLVQDKQDPVVRLPFAWLGFKHRAEKVIRLGTWGLPRVKNHSQESYHKLIEDHLTKEEKNYELQ